MKELTYEFEGPYEPGESTKDLKDEIIALKEAQREKDAEISVARLRLLAAERFNLRLAERAGQLSERLEEICKYTGVFEVPKPPLKTRSNAKRFGEDN